MVQILSAALSRERGFRPSTSSRERLALSALLAALLASYVVEIYHGLPNRDVVWGYDANPLIPLIAAKKIFLDGWNTGWHSPYPNFHYYVLLVFMTPYMAVQWMLGHLTGLRMDGGYPYGLAHFDALFMHLALITRLVSVAMALGTAYWVYRTGRALRSPMAGLLAACIVGFSPAVVYYVHVETLDIPMLFWFSAALYCYVRVLQTFELRYYVGLAILAAVSTATKDYAYGAFVLIPVALVAALARHEFGSVAPASLARAAIDRRHLIAIAVFVGSFAIAENWIWNFSGFVNHIRIAGGFAPESGQVITTSLGRFDALSIQRLQSTVGALLFVLGWAGFPICVVGVFYAALRERKILAMLAWPALSYYVFTICQVVPDSSVIERPFLPFGLMLAIFGGLALARGASVMATIPRLLIALAVAAIVINGIAMDAALATDPRYQAERWLQAHASSGSRIELYGLRSELPRMSPEWRTSTYNVMAPPLSDIQVSEEAVSDRAIAQRSPDWLVLSWAFSGAFSHGEAGRRQIGVHQFVQKLQDGRLGYVERASFTSAVSEILHFPPRLTPEVTIFGKQERSASP